MPEEEEQQQVVVVTIVDKEEETANDKKEVSPPLIVEPDRTTPPPRPQTATSKIFAPRTEEMSKGFLMFSDEEPGLTSKYFLCNIHHPSYYILLW